MREYVEKTLHTRVDCEPVDASGLPLYLRGLYSLERWTAFGVPFAVASPVESPTVKTMAKHRDALEAALGTPVSFALEGATGYRVGRMLEAGLPFIAPDKQVYLPFLGIALSSGRSHARDRRQTDVGAFSPQAQRLALMALYGDLDGASVTQAAGLLGAAKMTASRAFDELAAADPSIVAAEGRRRVLRPGRDKMAMWRRLEPRMSSPVAREHRLGRVPDAELPLGGISALCELSMLQDDPWADPRRDQSAGARSGAGGRRARRRSRRARGSRVRGAGAALRARAGAGMRGRPAFGHPVPSRRREGRPARRGRDRERFDPGAWRRS